MPTTTSTGASSSPRFGLPRTARVIRRKDFRRIYARGRRAAGKSLTVVALRRTTPGHRLGLSVSKANGCAVVRNKIKRILREAFRLERPTLPGRYDVILIPRAPADAGRQPGRATGGRRAIPPPKRRKLKLERVRHELRELLGRIESGKGRRRGGGKRSDATRRPRR